MNETHRPIPGFEGKYTITNLGRVFSKHPPCRFLKPIIKRDGYAAVNLCDGLGSRKMFAIHRLVMEAFCGPAPLGMEVSHIDGNPTNNEFTNLRYETHSVNCQRRRDHGTQAFNRNTRIPENAIPSIQEMRRNGLSLSSIAREFGCSRETIRRVTLGIGVRYQLASLG